MVKGIKPSLAGLRETICIYTPSCQIEIGASLNVMTIGNVSEQGALLDGGYGLDRDMGSSGWYNGGLIFRITPQIP